VVPSTTATLAVHVVALAVRQKLQSLGAVHVTAQY
jgi:hypothetical protein